MITKDSHTVYQVQSVTLVTHRRTVLVLCVKLVNIVWEGSMLFVVIVGQVMCQVNNKQTVKNVKLVAKQQ